MRRALCLILIGAALAGAGVRAAPPIIPIGLDAYRMWDHWPDQRIGQRTYMPSTYDRSGGNEGADASHFLYRTDPDHSVSLDLQGAGILAFVRTNHWHGSPWHYVVDGRDHTVAETSTADPNHPVEGSRFIPAAAFPKPLAWTWADTRGADLSWVPVGFEHSFQMAYGRTHYGTGYYIYNQYVPGARLSHPIRTWDGRTPPAKDVLDLIARSGTDIAPRPDTPEGKRLGVRQVAGTLDLPASGTTELTRLTHAPAMVRALEISAPAGAAPALGRARLRITWDDRAMPSVDAPLALFHGAGTLYNRDNREYLVKAFPVSIRYAEGRVHLACYFPMPFFGSADIALQGAGEAVPNVRWRVRTVPYKGSWADVGYFHATYRDFPHPAAGHDLVLLNTDEAEGGGPWCGQLVGMSWIFSHDANLTTLEGDPRFFFDDSQTPQAQGTGTEEWGGGGDYWGGRTMTLPFAGHPTGAPDAAHAKNAEDRIESAYRFLLGDLMPFGRNARIQLEHGGANTSKEHYESVTLWYGLPGENLTKTDAFNVGDAADEMAHAYASPDASPPAAVTSRYNLGPDTVDGQEVYPATTRTGRRTTGTSEFTLRVRPDNWGALLRRTLDYSLPNQRAEVFVADASHGKPGPFKPAGMWYLAGSTTGLYSNPPGELDPPQNIVQTSNRRFRDDEFLLPLALTRGRSAIRVRIRFTPVHRPLLPGGDAPPSAWSEMAYNAYCFVTPPPRLGDQPAREGTTTTS
jgi:hypothetical protein